MGKYLRPAGLLILLLFITTTVRADEHDLSGPAFNLIPWPAQIERLEGRFVIEPFAYMWATGEAKGAAEMFSADLEGRFGIDMPASRGEGFDKPFLVIQNNLGQFNEIPSPPEGDESYTLKITPKLVMLSANTRIGFLRGTRTILQLLRKDGESRFLPAVQIRDKPRFRRRSLLIDTARTFVSVGYLKRMVDLLADYKFNVLHLHITDDQGWRFESRVYPKLHKVGGQGLYYTQAELRELVEYARKRGVEILPEIDMPGHTTAMLAAYPELSCSGRKVEVAERQGILPYALCPAKPRVYEFIDELMGEVADVFPGKYVHVGSDEVLAYDWENCPRCKKLMEREDLSGKKGLHAYFLKRVNGILKKHGKIMIAWDEVTHFAPEDVVVQAWRDKKWIVEAASGGKRVIATPRWVTYLNYHRFIIPMKRCYRLEPAPDGLSESEKELVLGGGACMWGNYVKSEEHIDRHLFPRLLALSEVYWSPREARDYEDFKRRLKPVRRRLEERGVRFGGLGPREALDSLKLGGILVKAGFYMMIDKFKD